MRGATLLGALVLGVLFWLGVWSLVAGYVNTMAGMWPK